MATSAELSASRHSQWELVLIMDGIQIGFGSHADLETLSSEDGRTYRCGLRREDLTRRCEVDPRTGRIVPRPMSFELEDHVGDLPALFVTDNDSVDYLQSSVRPTENPIADADLHGKWIGHEKIGPAGERRQYPAPLGDTTPLHHHTTFDDSLLPIHPPPVSDVPVLWKGRRAVLYRVFRDHIGDASLDAGLRFAPNLETLVDGPSGMQGTRDAADGADYRGGPWRAVDFDGIDDRLDWGAASMPNLVAQPFTVSFWIYRRAQATDDRPWNTDLDVAGASAVFVDVRTNGAVRILWGTNGTNLERQSAAGVVPLNTWTQVTVKGDGSLTAGNYEIFINGEEVASYATTTNGTGTARSTAYRWSLGGRFGNDNNNVDGRMGNVRVWLRELTGAECLTWFRTSYGWRPFSEWSPIWWGVLEDDGEVEGHVWTLACAGYESWLQRDIGQLFQSQEQGIDADIYYAEEESYVSVRITTFGDVFTGALGEYGHDDFTTQLTATTQAGLREQVAAALVAAGSATGVDGAWTDLPGCALLMSPANGTITFMKGADVADIAIADIGLHKRIWGYLGWDLGELITHNNFIPKYEEEPFLDWPPDGSYSDPPSEGYALLPIKLESLTPAGFADDDQSTVVEISPNYSGGVMSIDPAIISTIGQILHVELPGTDLVSHYGQLYRPPASNPVDGGEPWPIGGPGVDRQGMWLLSGKVRYANTEEEIDEYQVVDASWRNSDGIVSGSEIVATRLYNPRAFGFDRKKLSKPWNAQPRAIKARPMVYLGYRASSFDADEAHVVIQRLMLSTGTSTGWWSDPPTNTAPGYDGENAVLDAGDNENDHDGNVRRDAEFADMGLAIPEDFLQHASHWAEEAEAAGDAIKCRVAFEPGLNSEEILDGLMQPIGWAWSLRNGRYGIWTPFAQIEEEDVEVAITRSSIDRGTAREMIVPTQQIREFAPIDRFKVKYSRVPYLDAFEKEREHRSLDRGRRYRPGGIEEEVEAPWFRNDDTTPVQSRLQQKAEFWERRHFAIKRLPVLPTVGRQLWSGSFVRFGHELAVDPILGTYGVAGRRGACLAVEEALSRERPKFFVDFLIHADRTITPKLHAMIARGYGYDSDNDRILVHDNMLAIPGDGTRMDSAFFVEPEYVGLEQFGGDLRVQWLQWDGLGWETTGTGVVTAVGTTPGACYLEMSGGIATGTYYPCKDTIVTSVPFTDQDAAWALELYSGIGDDSGEVDTGVNAAVWEDLP